MTIDSSIPQVCPNCNYILYYDQGLPEIDEVNGVLIDRKRCKKCGYKVKIHYDYCYWEED